TRIWVRELGDLVSDEAATPVVAQANTRHSRRGTPKDRGFSVYRDVAEKLERLGVPGRDIAFIQDYDSDASKLALFRDVRAGKVRILFGSTQKMGSGTNVQERLIALHHLDAPWPPADVEQREGRILRQRNKHSVAQ